MDVTSVTVGFPVRDLPRAVRWYQRVFGLGEPELNPADGNQLSVYSLPS